MAFRSNGGHIAGEDISAYVDEELSSRESARVAAHLQTCDECRFLADDMRATQTLVRELPIVRAPREFTLGPQFDVAPGGQQTNAAPKRGWFNFMPAVAMSAALLLLLVFADLSSLSVGSNDSGGSSGPTSSAARSVEDAAKAAQESAPQPAQVQPAAPRQSQPVPGSGGANTQGFGPTPVANAAGAPATAPQPGTQIPLLAPAPSTPAATGVLVAPPPAVDNTAGRVPTPTSYAVIVDADEAGGEDDAGGIGVLRVLEVVAAVVLAGSLVGLSLQKRRA